MRVSRLLKSILLPLLLFSGSWGPLSAETQKDLFEKANSLLMGGEFDVATPILEKLLKSQPASDPVKMALMQALLFRKNSADYAGDLRRSLALLAASIRLHEGIPGMEKSLSQRHFYSGLALWYLNQSEMALAAFDRAFRIDPSVRQPALYNSITILEELGRYEEARVRKQNYSRIAKDDPFR